MLGLLLHGKRIGVIETVRPLLDAMIAAGFFIDAALYRSILHQAGEEPPP